VVGRAVRNTGSRPLLVAEIAEHWPVVMDSCLLRWSLEGRAQAGAQGASTGGGSIGTGTSGGAGAGAGGGAGRLAAGGTGTSGSTRTSGRDELLAQARAAFRTAQYALLEDADAVEVGSAGGVAAQPGSPRSTTKPAGYGPYGP
jgi:hypothetical protein